MNEDAFSDVEEKEPERVSTMKETDKKCPACGGVMDFDPTTGGLSCPYCGHTQAIEQNDRAAEQDFYNAENTGNCDWGAEKKTVICKSCGAESVYDALEISNECPYCGSNQVMEAKGKDTLAPGGVCPFKIDIKQAGANFKGWIKRKLFCPSEAKKKAEPESFKGVYLPYWTFDANTSSQYTARYGIERRVRRANGETDTVTDWYPTSGVYNCFINDQLVNASNQENEAMLRTIEPFDTENNVAYKPEYVAGFASQRYSIGLKDAWEKAKIFIKNLLTGEIRNHVKTENNADSVDSINFTTLYTDITYKYLLLPVWISSFKYKGKIYQFVVNGQTGKVGGKTPISPLRVAIAIVIGIIVLIGVIYIAGNGDTTV